MNAPITAVPAGSTILECPHCHEDALVPPNTTPHCFYCGKDF